MRLPTKESSTRKSLEIMVTIDEIITAENGSKGHQWQTK
jgi:hypothetical protein